MLYNLEKPKWIDLPITYMFAKLSEGTKIGMQCNLLNFLVLGFGIHKIGFLVQV